MKAIGFGYRAFGVALAVPILAALSDCGSPTQDPGRALMPQTASAGTRPVAASRVTSRTSTGDLLYVAATTLRGPGTVYVFTYPGAKLVGKFHMSVPGGTCADQQGNVWIVDHISQKIFEYAHGGTTPINTLNDPYMFASACSVDPTTGNLAVTNGSSSRSTPGNVAIYPNAKGPPQIYSDQAVFYPDFCGYDNKGNLFINGEPQNGGSQLAELPAGGASLINISLTDKVGLGDIQWDGSYMTIARHGELRDGVYRLQVEGSHATVVGFTKLKRWHVRVFGVQSWIQGNTIVTPYGHQAKDFALWNYPAGGRPTLIRRVNIEKDKSIGSVVVSVGSEPR